MTAWIGMTPRQLLSAADDLLADPPAALAGRWPLAVAILCRQALETAMEQLYLSRAPGLNHASFHAQLLCLRQFVDRDLAARVDDTWGALSNACHQHAYELSPTAGELGRWFETAEELVRVTEHATPTRRAGRVCSRAGG